MGGRPTMQMVAELAGVSRGTVDRVLNNRPHVNEEVRKRVLEAIRKTGYVPARASYQQLLTAAAPPLSLGVLLPNWEGQFQTEVNQGIQRACGELEDSNVQVMLRRCKTNLPQEAIGLMEDLLAEGIAGLAVCAVNDPSIEKRISELAEAGIPCVTFNSDLPGSRRLCFVGQDIRKAGRVAAGLMRKCLPPECTVLAMVGNLKFDGHRQRLDGFRDRMRELGFPEERILVRETFNDYETTFHMVRFVIEECPDLGGVYMANLNVSGCAAAIESAGKKGQIRVVCHDINESVRQLILNGSVDFTIPQNMTQQGYAPLMLLRDHIRKKKPVDFGWLNGQIDVLDRKSVV